jgi:hypothetical protein
VKPHLLCDGMLNMSTLRTAITAIEITIAGRNSRFSQA